MHSADQKPCHRHLIRLPGPAITGDKGLMDALARAEGDARLAHSAGVVATVYRHGPVPRALTPVRSLSSTPWDPAKARLSLPPPPTRSPTPHRDHRHHDGESERRRGLYHPQRERSEQHTSRVCRRRRAGWSPSILRSPQHRRKPAQGMYAWLSFV